MSRQVPEMSDSTQNRRSAELISLTDALATIDRTVEPVSPVEHDLRAARGHTLAADARTDTTLRLAGARLRRVDIALLSSHSVDRIAIRKPLVLVMHASSADGIEPTAGLIAGAIDDEGGIAAILQLTESNTLEAACNSADEAKINAIIATSGGDVRDEAAVRTLARIGHLEFDGVGLNPGGATAFGFVDSLPVLLLPGQIHSAFAAWLVLGRRLLARLSFRLIEDQPYLLELARPVVSTRGMAEVIPVHRRAAQVEPLTSEGWTPQTIARADGWILVPAESDGHPAGTKVAMRPWP